MTTESDYFLAGEPRDIGQRMQLFLDSDSYADRWDVVRRVNEPAKYHGNPVVVPDQPWERAVGLPNVIWDDEEQLFRMWYANYDSGRWGGDLRLSEGYKRVTYMISYAESADGLQWTKPLRDLVPYMGFDRTNIIFQGRVNAQEFHVMLTPQHMRERGKFMLWYRDLPRDDGDSSVMTAFSDDGIGWSGHRETYPWALDAEHSPIYDEERGLWLLYARPHALAANERRFTAENVRTRVSVSVSEDLESWTPPRHIVVPDELDLDPEGEGEDTYFIDRMSAMKYGNQYIGFLSCQPRHGTGRGHIELTSSPDGIKWHRSALREAFIAPGREGDWDGGHTWMVPRLVTRGHWIYFYYVGSDRPWRTRFPENTKAIGMARIRRDRFVGQYGDIDGGWLLSREVKVSGSRLLINCSPEHRAFNMRHRGRVRVELLDRTHGPGRDDHLAGYGLDDCDPIRADDYAHVVTWQGDPDLSALRGKPIYLRFYMESAYLFGFRFADE